MKHVYPITILPISDRRLAIALGLKSFPSSLTAETALVQTMGKTTVGKSEVEIKVYPGLLSPGTAWVFIIKNETNGTETRIETDRMHMSEAWPSVALVAEGRLLPVYFDQNYAPPASTPTAPENGPGIDVEKMKEWAKVELRDPYHAKSRAAVPCAMCGADCAGNDPANVCDPCAGRYGIVASNPGPPR